MAQCSLHPARCKLHRFIFEASKIYVVLCVLWGGFALFVMTFFVVCIPLCTCTYAMFVCVLWFVWVCLLFLFVIVYFAFRVYFCFVVLGCLLLFALFFSNHKSG